MIPTIEINGRMITYCITLNESACMKYGFDARNLQQLNYSQLIPIFVRRAIYREPVISYGRTKNVRAYGSFLLSFSFRTFRISRSAVPSATSSIRSIRNALRVTASYAVYREWSDEAQVGSDKPQLGRNTRKTGNIDTRRMRRWHSYPQSLWML